MSWIARPWLALYHPSYRNLLAQRLAERAADGDDAAATPLPFELWLHIAELSDFTAVCRLATVCRVLWPLGRHPSVWERRCREAFCLAGHAPCDRVIRDYAWSWQRMFLLRPRLRFDGVYMSAHTKLLAGLNEGRGMKEKDVDFYARCGKWVTYYRLWRFYDDGAAPPRSGGRTPVLQPALERSRSPRLSAGFVPFAFTRCPPILLLSTPLPPLRVAWSAHRSPSTLPHSRP